MLTSNELQENYTNLQIQYDNLLDEYINLQGKYDTLKTYISNLILPAQYLVFAEAVRRYYASLNLGGTTYCPTDVIRLDEKTKKAFIAYLEDCMTCYNCLLDCPANAITLHPFKKEQPQAW